MNRQDILALGLLIVILGLFFGLAAPKTYKVGKFDGTNINFMAGETFTLTIDRGATTDAEISKMNVREYAKYEEEIDKAVREGRIQP